ncbi:hypothetical protein GCM10027168_61530 [Streptomyces capparidis]
MSILKSDSTALPPTIKITRVPALPGGKKVSRLEKPGYIEVRITEDAISLEGCKDLECVIQLAFDTDSLQQGLIAPPGEGGDAPRREPAR